MDHMMPKMDGIEATKLIRELGYTRPIVALTANAVVGQADMFLSNGFDEFISKPIDIRQMNALLNKLIRDKNPLEVIAAARKQKYESETMEESGEKEIISEFLFSLGKISEINTEIGLYRFSGMEDMYNETTRIFHRKLLTEINDMSSYLDSLDIDNFTVLIHAMKSSLATIGAIGLSEAAFKLESSSKKYNIDYCLEYFPLLKEKLISLHEQLSVIFPDVKNESQKERGEAAYLREYIRKAIEAAETLENDACEEAINNLLAYDFGEQTNALLQKAMDAVNDFKYGEASKILGEIEKHGPPPWKGSAE
jgi:CheY-like chemotaxis protein